MTLTLPVNSYTGAMESKACPRCDERLRLNYEELSCIMCGYVDYSYIPPSRTRETNLLASSTRSVLRYNGAYPVLSEMLVWVEYVPVFNHMAYSVQCPFCNQVMRHTSLSGKRREQLEDRYLCPEGHRVSLFTDRSGAMGWR